MGAMPPENGSRRERLVGGAGIRLFTREEGTGPPVVLLHGFPQTGEVWSGVAPALVQAGHRVVIPDLPGYGRSDRPLGYDIETLGQTLAAFIANVAGKAVVVGHDWGGSLAFRLASHHPEVVERMVVVNAPYRKLDLRRAWHMVAFNIPVLPELAFMLAGGSLVDGMLRLGSARREAFTRESTAPYRENFGDLGHIRAALAYYRTSTRAAIMGRRGGGGKRIEVPAMIVWGMKDPALPVHLLEGIERDIPHARIERLPDVGHFVPDEDPAMLAKLLVDFC